MTEPAKQTAPRQTATVPLQLTFHGVDHSDAVEEKVRRKTDKLAILCNRITACRVVIESHHHNTSNLHKKGEPFHVRVGVSVPGTELVVGRDPKDCHINEDIGAALNQAFDSMERKLKVYLGKPEAKRSRAASEPA